MSTCAVLYPPSSATTPCRFSYSVESVHLAVDAVEVANFVWIQVDADADAFAAPRHHNVDVAVFLERAAMIVDYVQFPSLRKVRLGPPGDRRLRLVLGGISRGAANLSIGNACYRYSLSPVHTLVSNW